MSAQVVRRRRSERQGDAGAADQRSGCLQSLNASLANLNEMTARINAGEGCLGRLLKDDALAKSLTSASGNLDRSPAS